MNTDTKELKMGDSPLVFLHREPSSSFKDQRNRKKFRKLLVHLKLWYNPNPISSSTFKIVNPLSIYSELLN